MDNLLSYGERISNYTISEYFKSIGINSIYCDSRKFIKTDNTFGSAKVNLEVTNDLIKQHIINFDLVPVITGFIASTVTGETTTLGRGGSDYTAAIVGAALDADEIEIWTDVNGVLTADPRKVDDSFPISYLSYEEAMELSHFGAKVIHPPTMYPAMVKNIPIRIKNTFNPSFTGTLVQKNSVKDRYLIKGISSIDNVSLLRVQGPGMVGVAGIAKRLFGVLAAEGINIILITQASSEHSICFAVLPKYADRAKDIIKNEFYYELKDGLVNEITVENGLSIVAVVGENMRSTAGIAGNLFLALGEEQINIVAIAQGSSELNISMVINDSDLKRALNLIHKKFFFNGYKEINLFIAE
jgi:aspartokinase/homoserine dehydrogenase 1